MCLSNAESVNLVHSMNHSWDKSFQTDTSFNIKRIQGITSQVNQIELAGAVDANHDNGPALIAHFNRFRVKFILFLSFFILL